MIWGGRPRERTAAVVSCEKVHAHDVWGECAVVILEKIQKVKGFEKFDEYFVTVILMVFYKFAIRKGSVFMIIPS